MEIYPDSRRMGLRTRESEVREGECWLKLVSKGRNGRVWSKAIDLLKIVVKLYDLGMENREIRFQDW